MIPGDTAPSPVRRIRPLDERLLGSRVLAMLAAEYLAKPEPKLSPTKAAVESTVIAAEFVDSLAMLRAAIRVSRFPRRDAALAVKRICKTTPCLELAVREFLKAKR